jgi:putative transposase
VNEPAQDVRELGELIDRRRIVHLAVTAHPGAWTGQQLREACPWDSAPQYLIHDRDHAFDGIGTTANAKEIREVLTAPGAPWQNAYAERFIGSVRRECLDHVLIINAAGLRHLLQTYRRYYERSRTDLSLAKDTRISRRIVDAGPVVTIPEVGGTGSAA